MIDKRNTYSLISNININEWINLVDSSDSIKVLEVLPVTENEYIRNSVNVITCNKMLSLSFIELHSNRNGEYSLKEFYVYDNSVYLKCLNDRAVGQSDYLRSTDNSNPHKLYSSTQFSPLSSNSTCGRNPCFMGCWSLFSIFGFILLLSTILSTCSGTDNSFFGNNFNGCINCWDKFVKESQSDSLPVNDSLITIDPKLEPLRYIESLNLIKSDFIDVSLLWNSKNNLDIIAVSPEGELLWKNNTISTFGICDVFSNESQLDSLNNYAHETSLDSAKSVAIEHLYFPKGAQLNKGKYQFYVLNSDKRMNCNKADNFVVSLIHNKSSYNFSGHNKRALNNWCAREEMKKRIYSVERLNFYVKNDAAQLIFEIEIE